ncbi:MAG: sigma-70 family RNA polymerase sigma factor [Hyphomicrobiales bacterium]
MSADIETDESTAFGLEKNSVNDARNQSGSSGEQLNSKNTVHLTGTNLNAAADNRASQKSQAAHFAVLARRIADHQEKAAFTEVFDHFAPRLKAYLLRLGAQGGQAEELVQEVMITLWRKANLFDPAKSSLATWLFRIARNRQIDALRRDKRGELDPDDPSLHPQGEVEAGELMDAQMRDERVRESLKQLPEEQLELVRMAFFQGLSHSQISEKTDLPLGTVKSRIRLAFSRLRKTLEADDTVDI